MENLIYELIEYGVRNGLIPEEDIAYRINVLAEILGVSDFEIRYADFKANRREIAEILRDICEKAYERGKIEDDGITYLDLFDTKVMGAITPPPSEVQRKFRDLHSRSAVSATDWYYAFSQATNYIRRDRIV